ncbi:MAG: hypothetical protein C4338_06645, partial [Rhodanobacteraceae bacterium]
MGNAARSRRRRAFRISRPGRQRQARALARHVAEHFRIAAGGAHHVATGVARACCVSADVDSVAGRQRLQCGRADGIGSAAVTRVRGAALLFALWAIALLAALLAGLAVGARGEAEASRYAYEQARARYAAEAGIARAVDALRDPDSARRWVPDGREYRFDFDGTKVAVRIEDTSGQVDLNAATPQVLTNLFLAAGANAEQARALADAVQDWRDADDIPHAHGAEADAYRRAGLQWLPRNGPFRSS